MSDSVVLRTMCESCGMMTIQTGTRTEDVPLLLYLSGGRCSRGSCNGKTKMITEEEYLKIKAEWAAARKPGDLSTLEFTFALAVLLAVLWLIMP